MTIPDIKTLDIEFIEHFGDGSSEAYGITTVDGLLIMTGVSASGVFMFNSSRVDEDDFDIAKSTLGKAGTDVALFFEATKSMVDTMDAATLEGKGGAA